MRPTRSPRPATLFPFTMLFLSHVEPFAPCYSRLLPRGPLPRTAGGSPQRRRRRLSLRLPMKTLIAPLLAAALLFGTVAHARSDEHTSELQSLMRSSYAVFGLKKKIQHDKKKEYE